MAKQRNEPRISVNKLAQYVTSRAARPEAKHCMLIDLGSGVVYPGIKSIKQRMKDVESACAQIAALWPSITE